MENNQLLNSIPVKIKTLVIEKINDENSNSSEGIIIIPERGEVKIVNEVGYDIFELINGENTVLEILNQIGLIYNVPNENIEQDIINFIKMLIEKNIIEVR